MSIYLARKKDGTLKSPFWQFDFVIRINGESRRVHGSTGETVEKTARAWVAREKTRLKSERPLDHLTLGQACYRYSGEVGKHLTSADDLETAFEHCCRLIGDDRKLVNITAEDIATAVRKRSAETVGKNKKRLVTHATVNRQIVEPMMRLMRRARLVWRMSCEPDLIPWSDLKLKEPLGRVREFSTDEGKAFWEKLRPDYVPLVWFLAARGLRVRAALGMKRFDVDLTRRTINVWKKNVGKVKVTLSAEQCAVIKQEMGRAPSIQEVWTFEVQHGKNAGERRAITYDGLRRILGTVFKHLGINDFHIHDLRHDFASKLLRSSRNLALVQKALGHSDIKSTVRYAHVLEDEIAEGMSSMNLPEWSRNDFAEKQKAKT